MTYFKKFLKLFLIGSKPINFAYPLPIASFVAFSISNSNIFEFLVSYIFCAFFFTAANLWNHINDAEEDAKTGRGDAAFLLKEKELAIFLAIFFYILSALTLAFTKDSLAIFTYLPCLVLTWIYSDRILLGTLFRRLKENYRTELLTYLIVTFTFPMTLWCFFDHLSAKGFGFSLILGTFYLSGVILKDIKDYSADFESGYRTLSVVFDPETLLKASSALLYLAFALIAILAILKVIPFPSILTLSMLLPVSYAVLRMRFFSWDISLKTLKEIKIYTLTYPISLTLLGIFSLVKF